MKSTSFFFGDFQSYLNEMLHNLWVIFYYYIDIKEICFTNTCIK